MAGLRRAVVIVAAVASLSAPAWAAPDVTIENAPAPEIAGRVASYCMDMGWSVTESNAYGVVCRGKLSAGQAFWAQFLMANAYATTPELYTRFSLAQIGANTRVQASVWIETTMAYGQKKTQDITNGKIGKELQTDLNKLAQGYRDRAVVAQAATTPTPASAPAPGGYPQPATCGQTPRLNEMVPSPETLPCPIAVPTR